MIESMRMKALLAVLMGCMAMVGPIMANPITWEQAQHNAQVFLQQVALQALQQALPRRKAANLSSIPMNPHRKLRVNYHLPQNVKPARTVNIRTVPTRWFLLRALST